MKQLFKLSIVIFIFMSGISASQSNFQNRPYKLDKNLDTYLAGFSLCANIIAKIIEIQKEPLTEEEINNLNPKMIWELERKTVHNWDLKSQKISDVLLYSSIFFPAILYSKSKIRSDRQSFTIIWFEAFGLNLGLTDLTKTLFGRERPYLYGNKATMKEKLKSDNQRSFFSGHTSVSAVSCFIMAKMFKDYYPKSNYTNYVWFLAGVVPAVTGYMRVKAGKHFYTDVIVGYFVGASIGILIPSIHRK